MAPLNAEWLAADFRYYGALQHQQNMLQDYVRTATYHHAITDNEADFRGKLVMDVGAGTGILSLFAAQVTFLPLQVMLSTLSVVISVWARTGLTILPHPCIWPRLPSTGRPA